MRASPRDGALVLLVPIIAPAMPPWRSSPCDIWANTRIRKRDAFAHGRN